MPDRTSLADRSARTPAPVGRPRHAGPSPLPPARPHLPALDGVRGLAALLVLVHHVTPLDTEGWTAGLPVLRWVHAGWMGVDLFFVLSGFLITGILLDDLGKPHYFRNFYARRALRIFPLYYGVLFAVFVLLPVGLSLSGVEARAGGRFAGALAEYREIQGNQVWLWAYLSNVAEAFYHVPWRSMGHFWSLAVEEHFYLVWPAVVLALGRRRLVPACVVLVAASLALRLAVPAVGLDLHAAYVLTPCRLDGLAMGGLLAAVAAVVWGFYWQGTPDHGEFFCTVGFTLLAVAFTAMLAGVLTAPPDSLTGRLFRSRPLRFLGKYSYGIYVYNRLLVLPVRYLVRPEGLAEWSGSPLVGVLAMQAAGMAASVGVAVLSWHLYESQFLRLKRYFS